MVVVCMALQREGGLNDGFRALSNTRVVQRFAFVSVRWKISIAGACNQGLMTDGKKTLQASIESESAAWVFKHADVNKIGRYDSDGKCNRCPEN